MDDGNNARIQSALKGETLYGNDFSESELAQWFSDEQEAYFSLSHQGEQRPPEDFYEYSALTDLHGFRWLPRSRFRHVLGVGSGNGIELQPLLGAIEKVTILEPSDGFATTTLNGRPVEYVKPSASGRMPFTSKSFDLIVCLAALHHVANVGTVVREMARVLNDGGYAILREPTVSMGDWRYPRPGLTKRERGIPLNIFRRIIQDAGFDVIRETKCVFSAVPRLIQPLLRRPLWTKRWVVKLDEVICTVPFWSTHYSANRGLQRLKPTAVSYVLRKPMERS